MLKVLVKFIKLNLTFSILKTSKLDIITENSEFQLMSTYKLQFFTDEIVNEYEYDNFISGFGLLPI